MKVLVRSIVSTAIAFALILPLGASADPTQLNAGIMVTSKMNSTIDSGSARVGDRFSLTLLTPYPGANRAYTSAQLYGHVTRVVSAGQGREPVLEFGFDRIVLADGRQAGVSMMVQSQETQRHNNASNVILTAVGGMLAGNIIGKTVFKSNLGGPVGLIAGVLYADNKKTDVSLRQGSILCTEVRRTVVLRRARTTANMVAL